MSNQVPPFCVLVTRPSPQGEILCQVLQAQNYDTVFLPAIEIKALPDTSHLRRQLAALDHYDWAIFISRSAVMMSSALIHEQWPQLPPRLKVAAVGKGTAEALKQAALPLTLYPPIQWSAEGLLALSEFQNLKGNRIAIFCGQPGPELLASSLQTRGALVDYYISYRRALPKLDLSPCLSLLHKGRVDALVSTSVEGLRNLKKIFAESDWSLVKKIPLVLVSERIMIQAKEAGFENCFLAKTASNEAISQVLKVIRKRDDFSRT